MAFHDLDKINSIVKEIPNTHLEGAFEHIELIENGVRKDVYEKGIIKIFGLENQPDNLEFEVRISPQYPLKSHESESIKFINKDLITYNHVMRDGSICIHTLHSPDLKKKLYSDFDSLKNWILKYYINKDNDVHYEHIVLEEKPFQDTYFSYQFTDIDYTFKKGDFGNIDLIEINQSVYKEKKMTNYLVQKFHLNTSTELKSKWNSIINNVKHNSIGIFIFIEDTPVCNKRIPYSNWLEFEEYFSEDFLQYIYNFKQNYYKKQPKSIFPIFIGYKTINDEIHWIVSMCKADDLPTNGVKINRQWKSRLKNMNINWGITRNSSYQYLFGRGTFCDKITSSKILIIGVGAIGSMVAKTLVKCGVKYIDLVDYDVKEPENVCRSEYDFSSGLIDKVDELQKHLVMNSPFVEVRVVNKEYFETGIKIFHKDPKAKRVFEDVLSRYDLVFDCSTDNDLMYILNTLNFESDLINLSITNHAKDLVCAFHPNIYHFVSHQFISILENDTEDLHNPTGCWSPTFKASYNDINTLVQYALKHINILYRENVPKDNFTLSVDANTGLDIKLKKY